MSLNCIIKYCKFGNFRVTIISRIFYFRIISEFLNLRADTHNVYEAYNNFISENFEFARLPIREY